ncbi:hypothetical protein [Microbacterium sp. T32]|uniref:hypothetical protein n=1 Tax=Microbacterium sp. T32 TaxID=1776083 RepID=UPI0007AB2CA2|nr:hypothetical protein [Microbacterium sp. T32]KZE41350.1 hypothetical protein AVW09_01840 [Microbacterium sp. T32]
MKNEAPAAENGVVVREGAYRQGTRAVTPDSEGQKFRVRLMGWAPGATVVEGSSADYPVPVIVRDLAQSHPAGTRMRANHDSMCEAGGDVRRIFAKTISDPVEEADGMYADAVAAEGDASDFIRQFADVIGTSITASVELEKEYLLDDKGQPKRDENGDPIVTTRKGPRGLPIVERFLSMSEAPYNSVDFVEVPGADGAVVSLALESAKRIVDQTVLREAAGFAIGLAGKREKSSLGIAEGAQPGSTPAPGSTHQKDISMDEKAIKAIAEALGANVSAALQPLTDFVQEQKTAAEAAAAGAKPADAPNAVASAITALESINKIDGIELVPTLKEALVADLKAGKDISAGITLATSVAAEAKTAQGAQTPAAAATTIPGSYVAAEAATGGSPVKSWTVSGLGGK